MLELTTCAACGRALPRGPSGHDLCGCAFAVAPAPAEFTTMAPGAPTPPVAPILAFHVNPAPPLPPAGELWTERPLAAQPTAPAAIEPAAVAPTVRDTGRGWGIRDSGPPIAASWDEASTTAAIAAAPGMPAPGPGAPPAVRPTFTPGTAAGRSAAARIGVRLGLIASAAAVVSVVFLAGASRGGFASLFGGAPMLSQPAAIGGLARIDTAAAAATARAMQAGFAGRSTQVVSGVYGRDGVPRVAFVAARGAASATDTTRLIDSINASSTPFAGAPVVASAGGQEYACGAVAGRSVGKKEVLCAWADHDVDGFLLDTGTGDMLAALQLAESARAAAER